MNQSLINRYQPGGDIYGSLQAQYGTAGADSVAQAALTGDETQVNAALVAVKFGGPLNTSTLSLFGQQLATNPLGAPIESLNNQIGKVIGDLFKNPLVLVALAAGLFFFFGGANLIRSKMK